MDIFMYRCINVSVCIYLFSFVTFSNSIVISRMSMTNLFFSFSNFEALFLSLSATSSSSAMRANNLRLKENQQYTLATSAGPSKTNTLTGSYFVKLVVLFRLYNVAHA